MKVNISFEKPDFDYHASIYIFEDGSYDVVEFYSVDEDCNTVDKDWKEFKDDIENEISEFLPKKSNGEFGGYDDFLDGLKNSY